MASGSGSSRPIAMPVASSDFVKSNGTVSKDHDHVNNEPSMTRQEFRDECDINTIMARYDGYLSDPMRVMREPMYVDFTSMPGSLMDAMDMFREAEVAFMSLPAKVRKEFDNDPAMFVDYASDPENLGQMREWGLAPPAPVKPDAPAVIPAAERPELDPGVREALERKPAPKAP